MWAMGLNNVRSILLLISLSFVTSEIIEGDIAVRQSDFEFGSGNVRDSVFTSRR